MADRTAAAGGALFVVASLAAGPLLPQPPAADASAGDVRSWFVGHHDAVVAASLLSVVGALGLLVLVAGLRRRGTPLVSLGGGLLVTFGVLGGLLQAAVAQVAARLTDDSALTAAYAVERAVFFDGPALAALLLLGAAAPALPRWLGGAGLGIGVLGAVAGLTDLAQRSGSPAALGLTGFLLTVAWVAATTVTLARESGPAPARAAAPATA